MAGAASGLARPVIHELPEQAGQRVNRRSRIHGLRITSLMTEAFLVSAGGVALAEIGDKTQLLSLVLAARYRQPWPIVLGVLALCGVGLGSQ